MQIESNKVVSLSYELRENNDSGEVVEQVTSAEPFTFLYGAGNLLPKFESEIEGLKKGETFAFKIQSEEAYGEPSDEAVIDLPKSTFEINGELATDLLVEGNYIPMKDQAGNQINGKVVEVGEETVKMDFNHPMAGKDLHFTGEIVHVRDASEQEVEQGTANSEQEQQSEQQQ